MASLELDVTRETLTLLDHLHRDLASLRLCAEVSESRGAASTLATIAPSTLATIAPSTLATIAPSTLATIAPESPGRLRQLNSALRRSRSFSLGGSDLGTRPVVRGGSFWSRCRAWDAEQDDVQDDAWEMSGKHAEGEAGGQRGGRSGVGVTKETRGGEQRESTRARKPQSKAEPKQRAGRRRRCNRGRGECREQLGRFHSDPALRRLSCVSEEAEGLQCPASESNGTTGSSKGTTLSEPSVTTGSSTDTTLSESSGTTGSSKGTTLTESSGTTGSSKGTTRTESSGTTGSSKGTTRSEPSGTTGSSKGTTLSEPSGTTGSSKGTTRSEPSGTTGSSKGTTLSESSGTTRSSTGTTLSEPSGTTGSSTGTTLSESSGTTGSSKGTTLSESSGTTRSSTGTTLSESSKEDSLIGSGSSSPRSQGVTVEVVVPGEIPFTFTSCRPDRKMRTEGSAESLAIKTAGDLVERQVEFRGRSRSDTVLPSRSTSSRTPGRDLLRPTNTQRSESTSERVLMSPTPDHGPPCARKGSTHPIRSLHEAKSASLPGRAKPSAEGVRARHAFLSQVPSLEDVRRQFRIKVARAVPVPSPAPASTIEPGADQDGEDGAGVTGTTGDADREVKPPAPQDMRRHVALNLLDTEQSYVDSLRTLVQVAFPSWHQSKPAHTLAGIMLRIYCNPNTSEGNIFPLHMIYTQRIKLSTPTQRIKAYLLPLKLPEHAALCDPALVDHVFHHVPDLLNHHQAFLARLTQRVQTWQSGATIGDLLSDVFSKEPLVSCYSAYVDDFPSAQEAVRVASKSRTPFSRFLEQCVRENKEKQALADLMIKPVQRVPRYELIIKELLKHTAPEHADWPSLLVAQGALHHLAERINGGRSEDGVAARDARLLIELEGLVEGLTELSAPGRKFLRQELATEIRAGSGRKERSLFICSDLVVCTSVKRRSGSLRRSSISLYNIGNLVDMSSKYKLLWRAPLATLQVLTAPGHSNTRDSLQGAPSSLDDDLARLREIQNLAESLATPHQALLDAVHELQQAVVQDLDRLASPNNPVFNPTRLALLPGSSTAHDLMTFEFPTSESCGSFKQLLQETQAALGEIWPYVESRFLKAISIMKTRSGMQFSCATVSASTCVRQQEVWVCNSDGLVGQVCLLRLHPEPILEACVAVCSSRILCIAAVPGLDGLEPEHHLATTDPSTPPQNGLSVCTREHGAEEREAADHFARSPGQEPNTRQPGSRVEGLIMFESDSDIEEETAWGLLYEEEPQEVLHVNEEHEEDGEEEEEDEEELLDKEPSHDEISSSDEDSDGATGPLWVKSRGTLSPSAYPLASSPGTCHDGPDGRTGAGQPSIWLGTEDGCVHIFQSSDSIRRRKKSLKVQHAASVTALQCLHDQVFVSLANGDLVVYHRDPGRTLTRKQLTSFPTAWIISWAPFFLEVSILSAQDLSKRRIHNLDHGSTSIDGGVWELNKPHVLHVGSAAVPVLGMAVAEGHLWCGSLSLLLVLDPQKLHVEHSVPVGSPGEVQRPVACLVATSRAVAASLQGSCLLSLFDPTTFQCITVVDVSPAVSRVLAGSDAIIQQHKSACLRVTALRPTDALLWVGTSAGVLLTLPLPPLNPSSRSPDVKYPGVVGVSHGHTGHVRFITAVKLPGNWSWDGHDPSEEEPVRKDTWRGLNRQREQQQHLQGEMLVISGGDGYEDFEGALAGAGDEATGREDSTNHLLLWRV
uniref:rho guanine nucleotide exchange factor 17-like n=1 Tax=Myxine glutinosa TaxID=7769 RepID=UPI00358DF38C